MMDEATGVLCAYLFDHGEAFAAGWFELPGAGPLRRAGRAMRRHLERCALPAYDGGPLYPAGRYDLWGQGAALRFHYSFPFTFSPAAWAALVRACPGGALRAALERAGQELTAWPDVGAIVPPEFRLGGNGYTHSIVDYGRVVAEGLERSLARVEAGLRDAPEGPPPEPLLPSIPGGRALYLALQDLATGIRAWHDRLLDCLRASPPSPARDALAAALARVPWQPARTLYEGLAAVNLLYYLDGCDSLGRFDQVLGPLYQADLRAGRLDTEEGERLVRCMWENVDGNDGWNTALGGTTREGAPAYNALTVAALRAARDIRRPNLALRVRRDMPPEVWDAALDAIASGCGLPALYNEEAYLDALRGTGLIAPPDSYDLAFGGCTETMVHGCSNVGSLDAGLNLPRVLAQTLSTGLSTAPSFAALLEHFRADVAAEVARLTAAVSRQQAIKARHHPQLLRTLLIDDCLARGVEYNAGGARYNWSVINVGGIGNVVDGLAAVREVVFERQEVSGAALWAALQADYVGHEALRERLARCPRFGNDDPAADDLAAELSAFVFAEFAQHRPWRGGRFLPACLMFVTYADAGREVMATPDGRRAGAPIADSAGPVAGRDRQGPTAMMRSVSRLDMPGAPGTLVVNMRLDRRMFDGAENRAKTRDLLRAYFALGNMQVQVNVVDQETLRAALADPEAYAGLVVRVAGYSEYWGRLAPDLQQTVLERTVHAL